MERPVTGQHQAEITHPQNMIDTPGQAHPYHASSLPIQAGRAASSRCAETTVVSVRPVSLAAEASAENAARRRERRGFHAREQSSSRDRHVERRFPRRTRHASHSHSSLKGREIYQ